MHPFFARFCLLDAVDFYKKDIDAWKYLRYNDGEICPTAHAAPRQSKQEDDNDF